MYIVPSFCHYIKSGTRAETGSGHLGQLGHILSGSSGSDTVYKLSRSDLDSALNHMQ